MREIRLTVRSLARTPLYTLTAILSLALGIGATTAIFSMMDRVLLRTLPVKEPERLAFLYHPGPTQGSSSTSEQGGSGVQLPDVPRDAGAADGVHRARRVVSVVAPAPPITTPRPTGARCWCPAITSRSSASARRLAACSTRTTIASPAGTRSSSCRMAYWSSRFGADPAMLNQTMIVNGRAMTVVGVAQKGFAAKCPGAAPDIFIPITHEEGDDARLGRRDRIGRTIGSRCSAA